MRTACELRQRWLETVSSVMTRAGMYASRGHEMEIVGRMLLDDLCFVDERDDALAEVGRMLGDRYGSYGVSGPFMEMFGPDSRCVEWAFFDCWDEPVLRYVPGQGSRVPVPGGAPLVRSVRVPAKDFESGLVLTLYGKVLRWGVGWWIYHPEANMPGRGDR